MQASIAWDEWPGVLPFWVASDKGYFRDEKIDLTLVKMDSDDQMIDDLISGRVNFAPDVDLVYVIKENSRGNPLQIVGVSDLSIGGDAIIASKQVSSISKLKGQKVAVEKASLGEKLLYYALLKNGLSLKDIIISDLNAVEAANALIAGKVDAAVTFEPSLTRAKNAGNSIVFSSALTPGLLIDTIVANKSYIDSNPEIISAVLRAYFKAVEFIKNNPEETFAIGAKYLNISETEFISSYSGILQADLRQNINSFSYSAGYDSLYGNGSLTNRYLSEINEIVEPIDMDIILRAEFVRKINMNQ